MNTVTVLFFLALASGALSDPGGRGGPGGKGGPPGGGKKKMMPPLDARCFSYANVVNNDLNAMYNDDPDIWERLALEMLNGLERFGTDYVSMRTDAEKSICTIRGLVERATSTDSNVQNRPAYCENLARTQEGRDEIMDCPTMDDIGECVGRMGRMGPKGRRGPPRGGRGGPSKGGPPKGGPPKGGKGKGKGGPEETPDTEEVRLMICSFVNDTKKAMWIEKMIIKEYMENVPCSALATETSNTFNDFWTKQPTQSDPTASPGPDAYVRNMINTQPTLSQVKIFKECLPEYMRDNLVTGRSCDNLFTTQEKDKLQEMPSDAQQMESLKAEKIALLNGALQNKQYKKYLCMAYLKASTFNSTRLGVPMMSKAFGFFQKALKNATWAIKGDYAYNVIAPRQQSQQVMNRISSVRSGNYENFPLYEWWVNGQSPQFSDYQTKRNDIIQMSYTLQRGDYSSVQFEPAMVNFTNTLNNIRQEMSGANQYNNYPYQYRPQPRVNNKKILMDIWKENSDNPTMALFMMQSKVNAMEPDPVKGLKMFKEKLQKYVMKKVVENPNCNTVASRVGLLTSDFSDMALAIYTQNWTTIMTTKDRMKQNIDPITEKQMKVCIVRETYSRLGSMCTDNVRKEELAAFLRNLESSVRNMGMMGKMMMKKKVMSKLMEGSLNDGSRMMCDLYYLVESADIPENMKMKHFGMKLKGLKMKLWMSDNLVNQDLSVCPQESRQMAFDKIMGMKMKKMMRDDDDEDDEDDDMMMRMDFDDDDEDDEDDDEDDDYNEDDDEDDYEYGMRRQGPMMQGRPMMGRRPGMPPPPMMMKGKKKGPPKEKMEKMMKCSAPRTFMTCTKRYMCQLIDDMTASTSSQCTGQQYMTMNSALDQIWAPVLNPSQRDSQFDFLETVGSMMETIKMYGDELAPCGMRDLVNRLTTHWNINRCVVQMKVMMLKKMGGGDRRQPPMRPGGPRPGGPPSPPMFGQFGGPVRGGQPPQAAPMPQRRPSRGRFQFNRNRGMPMAGQWNRQTRQ